jgi:phosphomevalonate kinase
MTPFRSVTALSAPGKVLLTGGYLVLDRSYTGTVFALDARIHVIVQQLRKGHRRDPASPNYVRPEVGAQEAEDTVIVRSPQFVDAVWEYGIQRCENGGGVKVVQKGDGYATPGDFCFCVHELIGDDIADPGIPSSRPR